MADGLGTTPPAHFPLAVALSIYGYHFRKTCRVLEL